MRYAIVSDIHANLAAWNNVLTDIADLKADTIICLGDVVGYGPNPVEVLESVYRVVQDTLMGNHDAALCGRVDPETFSPRAKAAVLRHRALISPTGLAWLSALPFEIQKPGFRCAHGDLSSPARFRYIIEPAEALPSWQATREQLLFVGHSHLPGIYVIGASGTPHFVDPCDFVLEDGKRYIVNPGSVGYPRLGDGRSSYCLFDDETKTIAFRLLPFDSVGYRKALKAAGLGDDPWLQHKETQRYRLPWLRERLAFGKPLAAAEHDQDLREHARLRGRRGKAASATAYRILAGVAVCAALAAGAYAWSARRSAAQQPLAVAVPDFDLPTLNAFPLVPPDKNLLPVLPTDLGPGGRMEGWRYAFEDRKQQRFTPSLRDGALLLGVQNAGRHKVQLESPLINLAGTQLHALRLEGRILKSDGFSGTVFFQLVAYATQPDGTLAKGTTKSFEVGGNKTAAAGLSRKIELSKATSHVRFRIEAEFDGTLEIKQPALTANTPRASQAKESAP